MSDPRWLTMARQLPFGQRRKIVCCGSDPSMIISHTAKGFHGHCFRSADHGGYEPHGMLSLADLAARRSADTALWSGPLALPKDFTLEVPARHSGWLLKAGIGFDLQRKYGIGYSEKTNRVILPVYKGTELIAFTARATDGTKPKYIARHKDGHENGYFASDPALVLGTDSVRGFDLVVVEDILSAIRVGRLVRTIALLGTSSRGKIDGLWKDFGLHSNPTIAVWLDGDKGGRKGRNALARDLALQGANVIRINTPLDPKRYSNREIREILRDRLNPAQADEVPQGLQSALRDHT